jgi:hypothetical protein
MADIIDEPDDCCHTAFRLVPNANLKNARALSNHMLPNGIVL